MNGKSKQIDPKDPKSGAETERERGAERQTKGRRHLRKLFRRTGGRAYSDVVIKERIVDVTW